MATIFLEGFDAYGSANGVDLSGFKRKWPSSSLNTGSVQVFDGRVGGKAAHFNSSFVRWIATPVFAEPTLTVGAGIKFTTLDGTFQFLGFYENDTLGINVRLTAAGELAVYFGSTQLAVTTGLAIAANTWIGVELSVTVHNSTGSYDLRVNGASVLSGSGIDTQPGTNAWTDNVKIGKFENSSMTPVFDDIYIRNDSTFLGAFKVQTIFPNGDGVTDCTPSAGLDNFAMVDENPPDDDTTYVTGNALDGDLYDYENLVDVNTVHAVAVNSVCRQTDATNLNIKQAAKSGATTGLSAAETVGSQSYVHRSNIWETNPDTAAAWTPAEVNGAQFGFEIEAA